MARPIKELLRPLSSDEVGQLSKLSRSGAAPAAAVIRAKQLLALIGGSSFMQAASQSGRRSGDAVAHLVHRFNRDGLPAVFGRHGGGPVPVYTAVEREQILAEARRQPDREIDGTATWSLTTLQRSLRKKGLASVSTFTIWKVLREAGFHWQRNRSWCQVGKVVRPRKSGCVVIVDPDAEAKKKAD